MTPIKIVDEIAKMEVSRQMKYTLRRIHKGLCAYGGCKKEKTGAFYCADHRKKLSDYQRERYRKRLTSQDD